MSIDPFESRGLSCALRNHHAQRRAVHSRVSRPPLLENLGILLKVQAAGYKHPASTPFKFRISDLSHCQVLVLVHGGSDGIGSQDRYPCTRTTRDRNSSFKCLAAPFRKYVKSQSDSRERRSPIEQATHFSQLPPSQQLEPARHPSQGCALTPISVCPWKDLRPRYSNWCRAVPQPSSGRSGFGCRWSTLPAEETLSSSTSC